MKYYINLTLSTNFDNTNTYKYALYAVKAHNTLNVITYEVALFSSLR